MNERETQANGPRRFLTLRFAWILVLVAALLGTTSYVFTIRSGGQTRAAAFTVQRGTLPIRVKTGGSALSLRSRRVRSEVEGTVKILRLIEEGYRITQEDIQNKLVLVELDSSTFKDRIMDFEIQYEAALTQYAKAKQDYDVLKKENETAIQAAERDVKFMEMAFQKYVGDEVANELIEQTSVRWNAERALEEVQRAALAVEQAETEAESLLRQAAEQAARQQSEDLITLDTSAQESQQDTSGNGGGTSPADSDVPVPTQSSEGDTEGTSRQYGLFDEQRNALQLQQDAIAAQEKAAMARKELANLIPPLKKAAEEAGLDPDEFTGDPVSWALGFKPSDFVAMSRDERLGGEAALQRQTLRSEILLDQEALVMAKKSLDGMLKLLENDFVTEADVEAEQLSYSRKQMDIEVKEERERLFMRYDFPKTAEENFAHYEEALRKLDQVKKTAVTRLAAAAVDVASAEKQLRYREEAKQKNDDQLDKYKILAQTEGMVVYQERDWDEEPIREGLMVREGMTLLTIPDITQMAISANIPESVIKKVKLGQRAEIKVEAVPNELIQGEVTRVGALPSNSSRFLNPDLKLYETIISIKSVYEWLKPGMTAEVEIYVEDLHDALFVPLQAVTTQKGNQICYLAGGQARVVEIGQFNEKYIEIKSGLAEGDEVLLDVRPFLGDIEDGTEPAALEGDAAATAEAV